MSSSMSYDRSLLCHFAMANTWLPMKMEYSTWINDKPTLAAVVNYGYDIRVNDYQL